MINTLLSINKAASENPSVLISESEFEYKKQISYIANRIITNPDIKIVAIAGPSGSGKTTTAHLLMEEIEKSGEDTAVVSLDDFYLPLNKLPRLPDGNRDIESVEAMDIPRIERAFLDIVNCGCALTPTFDFLTKSRTENAKEITVGERGIVIVEGLHALNPKITSTVPSQNILKIYISVNTPVEDENGRQILSSRQIRLARRIIRDKRFRGAEPNETLLLWNNVVAGETKYLYCFKNTADIKLVTFHSFEPCVYKEPFCKMRQTVEPNTPCYDYFIRTANALERFCTVNSELVPENSLIREFIGSEKQ